MILFMLAALVLGFGVSFAGSIPPAAINLTAIRISMEKSRLKALWFSIGAVLVEGVFCFGSLRFASFIASHPHIETWIKWLAIPVFMVLGVLSLIPSRNTSTTVVQKNTSDTYDFLYGMFLSVINPLQVPFWVAYGTYFYANQWLDESVLTTLVFVLGAMLGTFALLYLYIVYATKVMTRIMKNNLSGKRLIGYIFLLLALIQLVQNLWEGTILQ